MPFWSQLPTALLAAATLTASTAFADTWPSKPITWVVPYAPGGSTDVVARTVGQQLGNALKQTVIVDNSPAPAARSRSPASPEPRRTATR